MVFLRDEWPLCGPCRRRFDEQRIQPLACQEKPLVGGAEGVWHLGPRAWANALPEKGRQMEWADLRKGERKAVPPQS